MPIVAPAIAFMGTAAGATTVAAGVGLAGTAYATSQNNKNVNKQIAQQQATADQIAAANAANQAKAEQNYAPAVGIGNSALDKLAQQYGLSTSGPGSVGPSAPGGAKYDVPGYIAANPDVAQAAEQLAAQGTFGPGKEWASAEDWVAKTQLPNALANGEQRSYPTLAEAPAAPAEVPGSTPMNTPAPVFTRPDQGSAPGSEKFFGNYEETEDYKFLRDNALKAVNNKFGARGILRSGAAPREMLREASGLASQDKNQWFGRQNTLYQSALQQFNLDRGNTNNNFDTDATRGLATWADARDYGTNQATKATDNLFRLAGVGQSALGQVTAAGSNATANSGNAAMNATNAMGGLYQQRADNNSALAGAISGFGQSALAAYGGSRMQPYTPVQPSGVYDGAIYEAPRPGYVPGLTTMPQPRF